MLDEQEKSLLSKKNLRTLFLLEKQKFIIIKNVFQLHWFLLMLQGGKGTELQLGS